MSDENTDFSELAVPGEAGLWLCWRHRKVQTRLRCGRCEKPICPKCTRMGPTGARCAECASNRTQHIYQASPLHHAMTFVAALVISALGATLLPTVGFYLLFLVPLLGNSLTRIIVVITGGKRGTGLAVTGTVGAVLGAAVPISVHWRNYQMEAAASPEIAAALNSQLLSSAGYSLVFLVIFVSALWYWIK